MGGLSGSHILIVGVLLFLFGGKKLPEFGAGLGKSIREFKKAMNEEDPSAASDKEKNKLA